MNGEEYEFCIDAYSPESIPMERLAEYLAQLAQLLGHPDSVHFRELKPGSTRVVTLVEREAAPKVRVRLQNAADPEAPDDIRKPVKRLDEMLRDDNAVGKITRGTDNIIRFPGREAVRPAKMGPFTQQGEIVGTLLRIGGKDESAHASIEDPDGKVWTCVVSREMAIQLAPHLYGAPLMLSGSARWERTESGEWNLIAFRAKEFQVLKADSLADVIAKLRNIDADWKREDDPLALLRYLREGSGEPH